MANPEAVMRAAQAGPKPPMGGGMPDMPPSGPAMPQEPAKAAGGLDEMIGALQGVGSFLQAQGGAGQEAMGHFQALLQSMAKLSGNPPQAAPAEEPRGNGRIHVSQAPGVQVL